MAVDTGVAVGACDNVSVVPVAARAHVGIGVALGAGVQLALV